MFPYIELRRREIFYVCGHELVVRGFSLLFRLPLITSTIPFSDRPVLVCETQSISAVQTIYTSRVFPFFFLFF